MRFIKCKFEKDVVGVYITPLIGFSWAKGEYSFWVGWLFWLFTIKLKKEQQ